MDAYARWGHLTEGGVTPLHYDARCCHVDGVCEWVACEDVVLSRLAGGALPKVAGLYAGSSRHVTVEPALATNGSTLLIFAAANVSRVNLGVGAPADSALTLVMLRDAQVTLDGGWWQLSGQNVMQTITDERGRVVSRAPIFAQRTSGAKTHSVSLPMGQSVSFAKEPPS